MPEERGGVTAVAVPQDSLDPASSALVRLSDLRTVSPLLYTRSISEQTTVLSIE